jgi:hypothetical protein
VNFFRTFLKEKLREQQYSERKRRSPRPVLRTGKTDNNPGYFDPGSLFLVDRLHALYEVIREFFLRWGFVLNAFEDTVRFVKKDNGGLGFHQHQYRSIRL